jgi:hypothetical protein
MKDNEKQSKASKKAKVANLPVVDLSYVTIKDLDKHGLLSVVNKVGTLIDDSKLKLSRAIEYVQVTGCTYRTAAAYVEMSDTLFNKLHDIPEIRKFFNASNKETEKSIINDLENAMRLRLLQASLTAPLDKMPALARVYKDIVDSDFGRARGFDIAASEEQSTGGGINYIMPAEFSQDKQTQYEQFLKEVVFTKENPLDYFKSFNEWLQDNMKAREDALAKANAARKNGPVKEE